MAFGGDLEVKPPTLTISPPGLAARRYQSTHDAKAAMSSCEDQARVIAKNIASMHSALMDQPDATRPAVDATIRKMMTEIERQTWERIDWLSGHFCPEWDQMWVDRKSREWDACTCDIKLKTKQ